MEYIIIAWLLLGFYCWMALLSALAIAAFRILDEHERTIDAMGFKAKRA